MSNTITDSLGGFFNWAISTLLSWLGNAFTLLNNVFRSGFGYILLFLGYLLTPFNSLFLWAHSILMQIISLISNIPSPSTFTNPLNSAWGSATTTLSYINAFLPLDTAFTIMGIIFVTWGFALLYRLIKSWIPTLS